MGRTLKTINQLIQQEEQAFVNFRRTLRRSDQLIFDELFAGAKKHIAAISQANHALPCEGGLVGRVLEQGVGI
jgi:hypothetical protein